MRVATENQGGDRMAFISVWQSMMDARKELVKSHAEVKELDLALSFSQKMPVVSLSEVKYMRARLEVLKSEHDRLAESLSRWEKRAVGVFK